MDVNSDEARKAHKNEGSPPKRVLSKTATYIVVA